MSRSIPGLLPRQAGTNCVDCSNQPKADCSVCDLTTQECVKVNDSCDVCSTIRCIQKPQSEGASSSSGPSASTLAGAIVGVLAFLAIAVGLFFWYKRSPRFRKAPIDVRDKPASAAEVLNRPDPMEKGSAPGTPNTVQHDNYPGFNGNPSAQHDPEAQQTTPGPRPTSVRSNPFSDGHSIQTTGTEGTNVIPIALVTPDSRQEGHLNSAPSRPNRSPELLLNLDHVNVSRDNLKPGAGSLKSGFTNVSRNSYLSGASYSSDMLAEAPMIINAHQGAVRHVLGPVKAEMVDARSPHSPGFSSPLSGKPNTSSPLAGGSLGAHSRPISEQSNPFSDSHHSMQTNLGSVADDASVTTFGNSSHGHPSPAIRQSMTSDIGRPMSMNTQAGSMIGSVIDIGSATRVNVGNGSSLYKTMVGRLVTPPTTAGSGTMQEQQKEAAEAYAALRQSNGYDLSRRTSGHSAISATADSILEAFPFVPPSPISNRPMRSPPVSPLAQQQTFNVTPASPASQNFNQQYGHRDSGALDASDLPAPPDRRTLGLSTGSQLSTASTGLGAFPFQIDNGTVETGSTAPSAFGNGPRQRASLDTLAITSDLSSYPLGFDKDRRD